ncbi:COG4315 family predicted lipoprotein [Martelella endophytica]|uniref:Lipoprotein n=1 Tax=Martelella endophytica TaxID=1486262 RepID=A0A0D5LRZ6_MAREN|nr:hypothetical protein [Martelella endophytica]AJY46740.1 hypothetical protein TM49_15360 [Martelella endophytica]
MKTTLLAAAVLVAFTGMAHAGTNTFQTVSSNSGPVLAGQNGRTLYTYDQDARDVSACYGPCAANWPPYIANSAAQPFAHYTFVVRTDGQRQWALNGKPLYFRAQDQKPGDTTGQDAAGHWQVARPA